MREVACLNEELSAVTATVCVHIQHAERVFLDGFDTHDTRTAAEVRQIQYRRQQAPATIQGNLLPFMK